MTTSNPVFRAATVLCLRPASNDAHDVEILFVRRNARATFMANAYVFPGGRVDPADGEADPALATRRCALRELFEEAGLKSSDPAELVYFARWITPSAEPKRFDADFFLWPIPAGQTPIVDAQEVFDLRFYTPSAALAEYEAGALNLPPPTACTLEDLRAEIARLPHDDSTPLLPRLLAACKNRRPIPLLPRLRAEETGGLEIVMPWDEGFSALEGEGAPAPALSASSPPIPNRITRCALVPPGAWRITREVP